MNNINIYCLSFVLLISINLTGMAQENFSWDGRKLILDNGNIKREVVIDTKTNSISCNKLFLSGSDYNYSGQPSVEFALLVNDKLYDGSKDWQFVSCSSAMDHNGGKGVTVKLTGVNEIKGLDIDVTYLMYPNLPVIRKYVNLKNKGSVDLKIEALDVEKLFLSLGYVGCWVYNNYARMKHIGPFIGNWDDPLVLIHDPGSSLGIALGNETPEVLMICPALANLRMVHGTVGPV